MTLKAEAADAGSGIIARLKRGFPFLAGLRTRLILLVLLAVLPSMGLVIYNAIEQRRLGVATAKENTLRMVRLAAEHQDEMIEDTHQLLVTLAQLNEVRSGAKEACEGIFRKLLSLHQGYVNLGVIRLNGEVLASALPLAEQVNLADRSYFQEAIQTRGFAVGEYQVGRISKKATLSLGYPVLDQQGNPQAVVFAALDLAWLNRLATNSNLPKDSSLTVLDRNRMTLVRHPDPENRYVGQLVPLPPTSKAMPPEMISTQPQEGTVQALGRDGVWRLYAFTALGGRLDPVPITVAIGIPMKVAYASANRMLKQNLICLAVVGGLALVAAWYGGNIFVLNRVRSLLGATHRLSQGDLKARTGVTGGSGELHQLAHAFDEMAGSLEKRVAERERAEAELKALNDQLEQRISERTLDLRRSNEDLEQFAYVASHDLQEPLRMITSYLQLLRQRYKNKLDTDANDFIGFAVDGAERMHNLIVDLLAYSRVGTRGQPFETTDCNVVLDDVLMNLQVAIQESGAVVARGTLPTLLADPVQLIQLFQNLIGNAVKFRSAKPPEIRVGAKREDDGWHFSVSDNGIGIDAKHFEKIFIIFQRLHSRNKYSGTGIGLAVCKKIVERHGGRIWLESEPGRGTTFHFTIPALDHAA